VIERSESRFLSVCWSARQKLPDSGRALESLEVGNLSEKSSSFTRQTPPPFHSSDILGCFGGS